MRPAKIVSIVGGVLLIIVGLVFLVPGGFLLWAQGTQRDSDGFYETSSRVLSTNAYALTTPDVELDTAPWNWEWIPNGSTAAVRMSAESTDSTPLFIGIGPTGRVSEYLKGFAHDEVTEFAFWSEGIDYRHVEGGAPQSTPGQQDFWVASSEGSGIQTLEWRAQGGNWTAVIMNADGSAQVAAAVALAGRFGLLSYLATGLTVAGLVFLAVGSLLVFVGTRRPRPAYPFPHASPPGYQPELRPRETPVVGPGMRS